ncbi:MAG: acyltransferase family protein [Coriobacteriales bacterium]|nr:acyltransferase family protein [Coriobacteriales bacterium]
MQPKRTTSSPSARPRMRALDGLRAFAIVAIMLYHLKLPWIPSGHLGVVIFFVLGGYFATTTVARAFDDASTSHLRGMLDAWWRRIRRIVPSVVVLVVVAAALCGTLNHVLLTKMRPDVLPSLGFFLNWAYIVRGTSYFTQIGGPSPLLHLWYLGVDMQFFLVWSVLLTLSLRVGKVFARRLSLLLAVASAVWMGVAFYLRGDMNRVYYGTDTRACALLLGSWLALAFPVGRVPAIAKDLLVEPVGARKRNARGQRYRATPFSQLAGIVCVAVLVLGMALVPADTPLYYYGGFALASLVSTLLLATLLAPKSLMGTILSFPLFSYVGRRSFSLYLWHFPIFALMAADKTTTSWKMRLLAVVVTFVVAEVSYWLVERSFVPRPKTEAAHRMGYITRMATVASLTLATAAYAAFALVTTPDETLVPEEAIVSTGESADKARDVRGTQSAAGAQTGSDKGQATADKNKTDAKDATNAKTDKNAKDKDKKTEQTTEPKKVTLTDGTVVHAASGETSKGVSDPVLIGDSVPGDADWSVRLPDALVDTYIGRRPDQAIEVIKGYLDQKVVGHVVVYACFSNTTASAEQLEEMIEVCGKDREVYLVATANPDGFQDQANELLREAADAHDNVHYVDWPTVLEGHLKEYLWADETHLRPEGAVVYVDMVTRAVAQTMVDAGGTTSEG